MRTLEDIDNEKTTKEKQLKSLNEDYHIVKLSHLELSRDIVEKQTEKKRLEIALEKSRHNIKQLELDIKILTNEYWRCKNG